MAEKATLYLENNKGMILDFTRSPQACDVYDFDGNLISGGAGSGVMTADITFLNTTSDDVPYYGMEVSLEDGGFATDGVALANDELTVKLLYVTNFEGYVTFNTETAIHLEVTGDLTIVQNDSTENAVSFTGDGTITISNV